MNRLAHVGTCGQVRFFDRVATFGKSDYLSLFEILPPSRFFYKYICFYGFNFLGNITIITSLLVYNDVENVELEGPRYKLKIRN